MELTKDVIEKFVLPILPYKKNALEPAISEATMHMHFSKHHLGYVNKLNKALEKYEIEINSLEELLQNITNFNSSVRNNAGGHYNHTMFWQILSPEAQKPTGKLLNKIEAAFQSYDNFKDQFKNAAITQFGSGWAWLVLNKKGILEIGSTPNQDNPLMSDSNIKGYPIIGLDMWEHAYYLDYQNNKGDYVDSFWNILDWSQASDRYEESLLFFKTERFT
jgi:Fe-Mn family superoxide dismutase